MQNSIQDLYAFQDEFVALTWAENGIDKFNSNLEIYLNKFPNKQVVDFLYPFVDKNLILVGYPTENKNFLLGQLIIDRGATKVCGFLMNSITHDITPIGESPNFNKIIGSIYYVLIDNSLGIFEYEGKKNITSNSELYDKVYACFKIILIKYLKLSELTDEKREAFDFICRYFFNIFYLKQTPSTAISYSLSFNNLEKAPLNLTKQSLENYTQISDLYNVLSYYNILDMTPNIIKYNLINGIGTFSYLTIHSSLQSLIATIIISKYAHPNFKKLDIFGDRSGYIETEVFNKFIKKINIDTVLLGKKIKQFKEDAIKSKL